MNNRKKIAVINIATHLLKKDGKVYAESLMDHLFWEKYLQVFSEIYVIARGKDYEGEDLDKWIETDHDFVRFVFLPDYRGPKGYICNYIEIGRCMKKLLKDHPDLDCAIMRTPNVVSCRFLRYWLRTGRPYAMEIVSNLSDSYYYTLGWFRGTLYGLLNAKTKKYAMKAVGVAYTSDVLEAVYPTKGIKTCYSSIDITREMYYRRPLLTDRKSSYTMIHVSTLALDSKGNAEFLKVQKNLIDMGYDIRSVIVGGGRLLPRYREMAKKLSISGVVRFTGHISQKNRLVDELRRADIMLFPTLTEGMPRSVIEAMANSLPCVTSDIPVMRRLVEDRWLCKPDDIESMTERIIELVENVGLYNQTSRRNYDIAWNYEYSILNEKRKAFYQEISS